ncbi:MAG: diguanylate cyclase [Chloroflexi bacterium]|nr:diguanylate cyclase [Chloroflexota bacterium]
MVLARLLWLLGSAAVVTALIFDPNVLPPILKPVLLVLATVGLTATVILAYVQSRIEPLVAAAEQIAAGRKDVILPKRSDRLGRRLTAAVGAMSTRLASIGAQASTDELTGLPNRVAIAGTLFTEAERSVRYRRPLAVIFADIDHFKVINDSYGHDAGDIVLRSVAETFRNQLRGTDVVGRYGGEEFMIVLPETSLDDAAALAEKLRISVAGRAHALGADQEVTVTASFGVTGGVGDRLRVDTLVREADAAMYAAKALGRDQVYAFVEPDDDSTVIRSPISPVGRARAMELGRQAHGAAADALSAIISPLPHYRGQPSALIATIVSALARTLDLPAHEIDKIRVAALLHDVGKVGIPQDILEKPSSLTPAEWRSVVQHPRIGQVILEQATTLRDAVPIILHHHERFGGEGYPYGLRGQEIPLGARIVAIADAYDAMIQDRPYKRKISHEAAVDELRRHAGTQFDPDLVEIFCDIYGTHAPEADPAALGFAAAMQSHGAARALGTAADAGSDSALASRQAARSS